MTQLEFHFSSGNSSQPELIGFLDSQNELSHSVSAEYPAVFSSRNNGESLWVEVQGRVVSHVAYVVKQFQHPLYQFPIGLIGSVATEPEFRKKGLATSLVRQALAKLKAKGCPLVVLWSANADFYGPVGFFPGGYEVELNFDTPWEGPVGVNITEGFSEEDIPILWKLYTDHGVGLLRTPEQFRQLLSVPKIRCLVRRDLNGVSSYILLNKGSDFTDVIHEWAGATHHVLEIIGHLKSKEYSRKNLRMIAPAHKDLMELEAYCQRSSLDAMGLIKILDRSVLRSIYLTHLRNNGISVDWSENLRVAGEPVPSDSEEEFIAAVFGSGVEDRRAIASKLPFFIWGLDSV